MHQSRVLAATAALLFSAIGISTAPAADAAFFSDVQGQWSGPGEIVAGKYKGTKFNCDLKGVANSGGVAVELDGSCRVGVFTQPMKATIKRSGKSYKGQFLDGAAGKGLDITSGSVTGNRVVFSLVREQLKGAMSARVSGKDDMNVTISVKVESEMVPVIAMSLKRVDAKSTASVD
ncbi:MAG: hypothetical protein MUC58_04525 [Rhizobiaceae bacterium]|jgi:hypothetical protein|nr:hypothetical protein [Rhizobiaceae bacterium]